MRLPSVDAAIAELGYDGRAWLRGHTAAHRLIPALYRFPTGLERERVLVERSRSHYGIPSASADGFLQALVALHHRYVPTRLLEWTRSLHVALFCALIREYGQPAIFVLNPTTLNAISGLSGTALTDSTSAELGRPARTHPVAFELKGTRHAVDDHLFTLHGADTTPLEEQCPACIRKIILTDEEAASARDYILSGEWAGVMRLPMGSG